MSASFKDETVTWFRAGEDVEHLQATALHTSPYPKPSRWAPVMLVLGSVALAASCLLYVARHLH